jgi:hypothetical protein
LEVAKKGAIEMTKKANLASFKESAATPAPVLVERRRGKHEIVAMTIRVPRAGWERLHTLALSEGVSLQSLVLRGLNRVFAEKGLKPFTDKE